MLNKAFNAFLLLMLAAFAVGTPALAQKSEQDVRALLQQRDREIKKMLGDKETFTDAQRAQLRDVINGGIDFGAMGRIALGKFWGDLSAEQKAEFVDVFSEIVREQSLSDLDVYRAAVTYESVAVKGDSAYVVTTTVYKDVPTKVEYALRYGIAGWHVEDIILDDVSTAEGYARSFQTVIRKRGFEGLMTSLRKKRDKMAASS